MQNTVLNFPLSQAETVTVLLIPLHILIPLTSNMPKLESVTAELLLSIPSVRHYEKLPRESTYVHTHTVTISQQKGEDLP